jgi:hypothetical protein
MAIETKTKLTSVKIVNDLYSKFKHLSLDEELNLQQLVNRTILLYIEDEEFRKQMNEYNELKISGSSF